MVALLSVLLYIHTSFVWKDQSSRTALHDSAQVRSYVEAVPEFITRKDVEVGESVFSFRT